MRTPTNLISRLPPRMQQFEEMQQLYASENPEFDQLWGFIDQLRDNQFVLTCDSDTLRKWERIFGIRPDYSTQSLEYRRGIVLLRLTTRPPLTYRWLLNFLTEGLGINDCIVDLTHGTYSLLIQLIHDDLRFINHLRGLLRQLVPSNMSLLIQRSVIQETDTTPITHVGLIKTFNRHISTAVERNAIEIEKISIVQAGLIKTFNRHISTAIERDTTKIETTPLTQVGLTRTFNRHISTALERDMMQLSKASIAQIGLIKSFNRHVSIAIERGVT